MAQLFGLLCSARLQEYEQTKARVVAAERHMLRAFGFIIHVEHPHRFVLNYGQMLGLSTAVQQVVLVCCCAGGGHPPPAPHPLCLGPGQRQPAHAGAPLPPHHPCP